MIVENLIENNYGDMSNLSRKDKVLRFLKAHKGKEVSTEDLSEGIGIAKSNLSKILKPLEEKGEIKRRYEQVGRGKYVWISLTNSQDQKMTNSRDQVENKAQPTKSQNNITNSHENMTNSQEKQAKYIVKMGEELAKFGTVTSIEKMQEMTIFLRENKVDLIDAVDNWLKSYKSKFNDKTRRQRERMNKIFRFLEVL